MKTISIVVIDDHVMLRKGLVSILKENESLNVVAEANNGLQFIKLVEAQKIQPDVVLLDIHMPEMDGFATAEWIEKNLPLTKVLVLSMNDNEESVIKMLRNGARGYVLKDGEPNDLVRAIKDIMADGYHLSKMVSGKLLFNMNKKTDEEMNSKIKLSEREKEFITLCCSDLTYKEIADKMFVSVRTVDGYRDSLFEKLDQRSRVGLVLYAIKNKFYHI